MPLIPPIVLPTGNYGPFPGRGEGKFPSTGDIDVWWKEPGPASVFNFEYSRRDSFHIFGEDKGTTVWRSAPLTVGSQEDIFGIPVGPPDSTIVVSTGHIRKRPQTAIDPSAGRGSRRKVFAELHSLQLRGEGIEILAGEPFLTHLRDELGLTPAEIAQVFRRSYGEIISWDLNGDSSRDLPADNHFNVFFAVKFDATADHPAITVFNKDPLVVVDLGIISLPPLHRVTIPQFPSDMPNLYSVKDPSLPGQIGESIMGQGRCCAHALAIAPDLPFRPMSFSELAGGLLDGEGHNIRTGVRVDRWKPMDEGGTNRPLFRKMQSRFIDSIFVPNGVTQITSSGLVFAFENTSRGGVSDTIRNGLSLVHTTGQTSLIHVEAPSGALAYQPPQPFGIGLGPNAGITFDIAALRHDNPDFYLVNMIAIEGMSKESQRGANVRLRVLVDGVEIPFANNLFDMPGASVPVSVDLQAAERYVTLVSTSTTAAAGNGVFALFQLRGFGALSGDYPIPYSGPARPL